MRLYLFCTSLIKSTYTNYFICSSLLRNFIKSVHKDGDHTHDHDSN